jgi:hypothetical protein
MSIFVIGAWYWTFIVLGAVAAAVVASGVASLRTSAVFARFRRDGGQPLTFGQPLPSSPSQRLSRCAL